MNDEQKELDNIHSSFTELHNRTIPFSVQFIIDEKIITVNYNIELQWDGDEDNYENPWIDISIQLIDSPKDIRGFFDSLEELMNNVVDYDNLINTPILGEVIVHHKKLFSQEIKAFPQKFSNFEKNYGHHPFDNI